MCKSIDNRTWDNLLCFRNSFSLKFISHLLTLLSHTGIINISHSGIYMRLYMMNYGSGGTITGNRTWNKSSAKTAQSTEHGALLRPKGAHQTEAQRKAGSVWKGGARERTRFSPQADTEKIGLCDNVAAPYKFYSGGAHVERRNGQDRSLQAVNDLVPVGADVLIGPFYRTCTAHKTRGGTETAPYSPFVNRNRSLGVHSRS